MFPPPQAIRDYKPCGTAYRQASTTSAICEQDYKFTAVMLVKGNGALEIALSLRSFHDQAHRQEKNRRGTAIWGRHFRPVGAPAEGR